MIDFVGRSNIKTDKYTIVSVIISKQNQNTGVSDFLVPRLLETKNPINYVYTEQGSITETGESFLNKNSEYITNGKIPTG